MKEFRQTPALRKNACLALRRGFRGTGWHSNLAPLASSPIGRAIGISGNSALTAGSSIWHKTVPCYSDSASALSKNSCLDAAALCSRALLFRESRALPVSRGPDRLAQMLTLGELAPKVTERARTPTKSFSAPFGSKNFLKIHFIGLLFCYTPARTKRHRREEE